MNSSPLLMIDHYPASEVRGSPSDGGDGAASLGAGTSAGFCASSAMALAPVWSEPLSHFLYVYCYALLYCTICTILYRIINFMIIYEYDSRSAHRPSKHMRMITWSFKLQSIQVIKACPYGEPKAIQCPNRRIPSPCRMCGSMDLLMMEETQH